MTRIQKKFSLQMQASKPLLPLKNADAIVVIPYHKENLDKNDKLSFENSMKILKNWDVAILLPNAISDTNYGKYLDKFPNLRIVSLQAGMMGSIEKYNKMCLNPNFYRYFKKYKYVCIVHLDAWIFRDELQHWINFDYDYIGAPLFLQPSKRRLFLRILNFPHDHYIRRMIPYGGNGGFSLRKVAKHIELTTGISRKINYRLISKYFIFLVTRMRLKLIFLFFHHITKLLRDENGYRSEFKIYEDVMISVGFGILDRTFNVCDAFTARAFSLEVNQRSVITTKSRYSLPFGVHGWAKEFTELEFRRICQNKALRSRSLWHELKLGSSYGRK